MKKRPVVIAAIVAALAVAAAGVAAAPWAVKRYAEAKIDKTLAQVRKRGTAVASRGDVAVDIGSRTVTVRQIAIDTPGQDGAKVRVGSLTVVRPGETDGRVTAEKVRFDDVVVTFADETLRTPSIEILGYDGPAEGLVGTPGGGKIARTQADIMGEVSIGSARIPSVELANGRLGVVRTASDIVLGRATKGLIDKATVGGVRVTLPLLADGAAAGSPAGVSLTTGAIVYTGLSVPAIMRFQAGDGEGEREPAVTQASIVDLAFAAPTDSAGPVRLAIAKFEARNVNIRALTAPLDRLHTIETRAQRHEALTPAELRQQILFLTDAVRALAFEEVAATGVSLDIAPSGRAPISGGADRIAFSDYADAFLQGVLVEGAHVTSDGRSAAFKEASVKTVDATGLLAYAERVGEDKALLTAAPPAEEMLKLVPRVGRIAFSDVEAKGRIGTARIGALRTGARGDADEVPNKIGLRIENFSTPVPKKLWFSRYFADAGIDRLDLSFRLVMSLDPTTKILKLDGLDYASPDVADIHLTGSLSKVDPALAISSGGDLISKLADVKLQPFTLRVTDHGGLAAAFALAAKGEGAAPASFVETFAQTAETRLAAVLGPSAEASATALGLFLRSGGTLEAKITPRTPDTPLLDLLGLIQLGPEGIAQALDVTIVNRTE